MPNNDMDKKQAGDTVVLSPVVLGQKRAEYQRLKDKNISQKNINQRMADDAKVFGLSLKNYAQQLEALKVRQRGGEEIKTKRKAHREILKIDTLEFVGYLNTLATTDWNKVRPETMAAFLIDFCLVLKDSFIPHLQDTSFTSQRGKQGWMVMLHAPVYNFVTSKPTGTNLLAPFAGGWQDAGRDYDQYGFRMEAGGSATFYRDVSFECPTKPLTQPKQKKANK